MNNKKYKETVGFLADTDEEKGGFFTMKLLIQ